MNISAELADSLYNILTETCGATEYWRDNFVHLMSECDCREYRFQGNLGFGGKLYNTDHVYVDCYNEDRNEERQQCIDAANERIKMLLT